MASAQSDFILRMIEQMGQVLRRLRARLDDDDAPEDDLFDESERAQAELFGPLWRTLRAVDAQTAISLIPESRRARLWIEFVRFEADAAQKRGDPVRAQTIARRADALEHALAAREGIA